MIEQSLAGRVAVVTDGGAMTLHRGHVPQS
jgi:hypothetical protein